MNKVKYIIGHWTAGNHKPNDLDLNSYQILIDNDGREYQGKPQGKTASTAGMNSITFNIACCGGLERTPITQVQFEKFCYVTARELKRLKLPVSAFYTHAEIGEKCKDGSIIKLLPMNQWLKNNKGKIDLTVLPYLYNSSHNEYIRLKIKWYYVKIG